MQVLALGADEHLLFDEVVNGGAVENAL